MSRITLYLIRELTSSFVFVLVILTSIAWLSQGLRYLELFTSESIAGSSYFYYILLLIPKLLIITVPISLFISLIFILNRMRSDSELIIFWASGKSNRNILLKPIYLFSFILFLLQISLSVYLVPLSSLELRNKIIEIRSGGLELSALKEKKFINPVKNLTLFIQKIELENIYGLLIQDNTDLMKPRTYIAEKGYFNNEKGFNSLRLKNGMVQILNKKNKKISEIEFDTYELDLNPFYTKKSNIVYPDERSNKELINRIKDKAYTSEEFGVLSNRIINPFYILVISILPLLMFKFSRRPDYKWTKPILFISSIALLIKFYEITISNVLLENNNYIFICALSPLILLILINIALWNERNFIQIIRKFI